MSLYLDERPSNAGSLPINGDSAGTAWATAQHADDLYCSDEIRILSLDDDALSSLTIEELANLLGIKGEPLLRHISRWPDVMPQYEIGH